MVLVVAVTSWMIKDAHASTCKIMNCLFHLHLTMYYIILMCMFIIF